MEKFIYIVVNHNGISMTVVANNVEHAYRLVKVHDYIVVSIREIGIAFDNTPIGVVE